MDLTPYLDSLRRDLSATAAVGDEDMRRAADLLAGSLDASARLYLLEALTDAAAEVTSKLVSASVEVRLRGRDADLVVIELTQDELEPAPDAGPGAAAAAPAPPDGSGDVARVTLRLPEGLKEQVERAAAAEGISVNAWLVRAIAAAVAGWSSGGNAPFPTGRASFGKRVTGYAQA